MTRYLSISDEKAFPYASPKRKKLNKRADGKIRYATPFEHVCGGNSDMKNKSLGLDGPSQYMSFSNAGLFEHETRGNCVQNWDKGQRRVKVSRKDVTAQGAVVFDVSTDALAWKWCYEGAKVVIEGKTYEFHGAKTIKPWPYKCAKSVWQKQKKQSTGSPGKKWWTTKNRKEVGAKCAEWTAFAKEVLILVKPGKKLKIKTDRKPAKKGKECTKSLVDKCIKFNVKTSTPCCCSNPKCGTPCPRAPGA